MHYMYVLEISARSDLKAASSVFVLIQRGDGSMVCCLILECAL